MTDHEKLDELIKRVEFLEQSHQKLVIVVADMGIDVKMLERRVPNDRPGQS